MVDFETVLDEVETYFSRTRGPIMSSSAPIPAVNVILAGSTGIPGRNILDSLQKLSPDLNINLTLLKRPSQAAAGQVETAPSDRDNVTIAHVNYEDASALSSALAQLSPHIIISALNAEPEPKLDHLLLSAALAIPASSDLHGSPSPIFYINGFTLDILHPSAERYADDQLAPKIAFAKRLAAEADKGTIRYCTIVNAGFIDYVLMKGYAGVDLATKKVTLFAGGQNRLTGCSLRFVGDVVAEVVRLVIISNSERNILETEQQQQQLQQGSTSNEMEKVNNKRLRVAEVEYSGVELLDVVRKVTGKQFEISHVSTDELVERGRVISALNWNGEGAAMFGEEGLSFTRQNLDRRSLEAIVREAVQKGVAQFEGIGR